MNIHFSTSCCVYFLLNGLPASAPRILVLSRNRGGVERRFALACVLSALKRYLPLRNRVLEAWVVMWVSLLLNLYLSFIFSYVLRGGHHSGNTDKKDHFLIRGFGANGHAYETIHMYLLEDSAFFDNGGQFSEGRKTVDLETECRPLVSAWVSSLDAYFLYNRWNKCTPLRIYLSWCYLINS